MSDDCNADEMPQLSAHSLAALQEFLQEQEQRTVLGKELEEDWQLSQFWYDETTVEKLTTECIRLTKENCKARPYRIVCLSCPTLYYGLVSASSSENVPPRQHHWELKLLEFDKRFALHSNGSVNADFVYYDFNEPTSLPIELKEYADLIIIDPPFLSEECFGKVAESTKFLSGPNVKLIICSGATMKSIVNRLFSATPTAFVPTHKRNLGNEFSCYVNYTGHTFV